MNKKTICSDCKCQRPDDESKCPKCGSVNVTVVIGLSDNVDTGFRGKLQGKAKIEGKKRATKEFKYGDNYSYSLKKIVDRTMIVDRENNLHFFLYL